MAEKLTEKELKALREYEHKCCDMMIHASISVRLLKILLDNYEENQNKNR